VETDAIKTCEAGDDAQSIHTIESIAIASL
jgi:hypothetical protein